MVSFPPKYRCTDELWDNQKKVVLKVLSDEVAPTYFRLAPDHTVRRTVLTQRSPIAHAWIVKNEINKKGFCGPVKVALSFWKLFSD